MPNKVRVQERQKARAGAQRRKKLLTYGGLAAVAVVILGVAAFMFLQPQSASGGTIAAGTCSPIQTVADEGRAHLVPGETPTWNTNPPVSGTHNPVWQTAGVFNQTQDITMLLHSLEHGYVVIYYKDLNPAEVNALADFQRNTAAGYKVIVTPYDKISSRVLLTAWDHEQSCNGVVTSALQQFMTEFRDHGPEAAP